jgi:hypothetical protein
MRKRVIALALAGTSIMAVVATSQAFAGAQVSKGETCTLQLSQAPGHEGQFPDITTTKSNSVQTNSKNDNSNANCQGRLPDGTPGPSRALVFQDVPCGTFTRAGTGHVTITPSGVVNFTCHFKE